MHKNLMIVCGVLMMFSVAFADDTVSETCADGAGTVVVGAVTGHKYCKSKIGMNWWNAVSWCDGMGRKLFSLDDCGCSNAVSDCTDGAYRLCPELKKAAQSNTWVWSKNVPIKNTTEAHNIWVPITRVQTISRSNANAGGNMALCK